MLKIGRKLLSLLLMVTILTVSFAGCRVTAFAAASEESEAESEEENPGTGKYVREVFIAYGKTEADAKKWLEANGWEPIKGDCDFNAGKNSTFDDPMAAVMGIRRTDDKDDAITDMAVMNMKGGYDFEDYKSLVNDKRKEINEFIDTFTPVLEEYRANYYEEGSALGKKRADLAYKILNKFYDGGPKERYAVNDTGEYLGKLFLKETRRELDVNGELVSEDELKKHADLTQIILESSGPAMLAVEQLLALGSDANEDTWLERLSGLSGEGLVSNLSRYAPESAGQNVSPSSAKSYLNTHYGDTARGLASQWRFINEEMLWYEGYCSDYELWPEDEESEEDYDNRINAFFDDLEQSNKERYDAEFRRFSGGTILYYSLYEIPYGGEWGETLGDFFNPYDGTNYGLDKDNFLTFAAALSPGQRAASDLLSLQNLLYIGFADEEGLDYAMPDLEEIFGDETEMSVYTGINRGIFRAGVALTSRALMDQNQGRGRAFDRMWDNWGIMAITSYASAIVGLGTFIAGAVMVKKGVEFIHTAPDWEIEWYSWCKNATNRTLKEASKAMEGLEGSEYMKAIRDPAFQELQSQYAASSEALEEAQNRGYTATSRMGVAGRVMMGVGGALMIIAAAVKAWQLAEYYHRDFTPIPLMIVDEADIVTYVTDDKGNPVLDEYGNQKKKIDFDQYVYYAAVLCNRDKDKPLSDWQNGVKDYFTDGCGDVADLNGDFGQEWLALYTVKSERKGDPILADSLTLQYKSDSQPQGTTKCLHLFTYTHAVDLGDMAWSFNNDKKGVYFFWDEDKGAFADKTASAFSGGQMALGCAAGLLVGILCATFVLLPKRKRQEVIS